MKKVLLINPHWIRPGVRDRVRRDTGVPHPGLLQIAEILIQNNVDVAHLDLGGEETLDIDKLNLVLSKYDPDVIGITAVTCSYPGALEIAKHIKKESRDIMVVGGGVFFSLNYKNILRSTDKKVFDLICTGEGELPMVDIVKYIEGKITLEAVRGIAYLVSNNQIHATAQVTPMSLPPVIDEAWSIIDTQVYTYSDNRKFGVAINTMRGCDHNCSFCTEPYRWPKVACMSAENMVKQFKIIKQKLDPSYIFVGDSNFDLPVARMKKFVNLMRSEGLSVPFNCLARLDRIHEYRSFLPQLREAGCFLIHYGGERTDDAGQAYLNKGEDSSITDVVTKAIQDADILAKATFIFGLPCDNKDTMGKMIENIYKINPDIVSFGSFTPMPGTPAFEGDSKFIAQHNLSYYTVNYAVCNTEFMAASEVEDYLDKEWAAFWKSPMHRDRLNHISNPNSRRLLNAYFDYIDAPSGKA